MINDFTIEKGNWTTTFNDIFQTKINGNKLSPEAWGLYVFMLSLPPEWDFTIRGLTKVVNAGKNKIQRILKELEDAGFITRYQKHDGRFGKMKYIIHSRRKIQCPQNQYTEKQYPENRPQLNTKEINTNKHISIESNKDNTSNIDNHEKEHCNEKFSLSITKEDVINISNENNLDTDVSEKFYYYYKSRNWKVNNNFEINKNNLKANLILWHKREIDYLENQKINNTTATKINKPDWIQEYLDEIKDLDLNPVNKNMI